MRSVPAKLALTVALIGGWTVAGQAGPFFNNKQSGCNCNSPYNAQQNSNLVPVASGPVYSTVQADPIPTSVGEETIMPATATAPAAADAASAMTIAGLPHPQLINSRSLVLNFDVRGTGSSGVGNIELWYTRNGQVWQQYHAGSQTQSPFAVDVPEDGLYGFTTVAVSGVGIAKNRPQPGDVPQVWVEVDTSKPDVHILGTQAGVDQNGRTLTVRWSATDKNFGDRPITLYYAGAGQATWTPFATNLPNTGHFTWRLAPGLPAQVLMRVEATDRVGNTGADQTSMPSPIDLARPSAIITAVGGNGTFQTYNPASNP